MRQAGASIVQRHVHQKQPRTANSKKDSSFKSAAGFGATVQLYYIGCHQMFMATMLLTVHTAAWTEVGRLPAPTYTLASLDVFQRTCGTRCMQVQVHQYGTYVQVYSRNMHFNMRQPAKLLGCNVSSQCYVQAPAHLKDAIEQSARWQLRLEALTVHHLASCPVAAWLLRSGAAMMPTAHLGQACALGAYAS